jgi:hypothetical protein
MDGIWICYSYVRVQITGICHSIKGVSAYVDDINWPYIKFARHRRMLPVAYRGGGGVWGVQNPLEIQSRIGLQIERKMFSVPNPTS